VTDSDVQNNLNECPFFSRRSVALPLSVLTLALVASTGNAQTPPTEPIVQPSVIVPKQEMPPVPEAKTPLVPVPPFQVGPPAPLGNPEARYPTNYPPALPADAYVVEKPTGDPARDDVMAKPKLSTAERLLGKWGKGLVITGSAGLRMQNNSVAGQGDGQRSFYDQYNNNLDYRSAGAMQSNADLTIQGKVFNAFDVNARLNTSRYGNRFDQVFAFNYENKDKTTSVKLGNVNASLPGNQFVTFSRSLTGVAGSRDFGKGKIKGTGVASLTRSLTKRGSFNGKGISGPYFLNASSLVEGSDKVQLNGKDLIAGADYHVDYLLGQIDFLKGRIINPEDTVVFTYESYALNTTPGLLTGTRWDFADRGNNYGVTYLRQNATGTRATDGDVTERFPVYADLRYKYQLSSAINPLYYNQVVVRWNNRTLVENVDYVLNRELRYFQLLTASLPPDTSQTGNVSLAVTYRPVRSYSLPGDRDVLGLDAQLRFAKSGTVALQMGSSGGQDPTQKGIAMDISGAWQAPGSGTRNRWGIRAGFRNIDDTFSTIDSTAAAFLSAERGLRFGFDYQFDPTLSLKTNFTRSQIANKNNTIGSTITTGKSSLNWQSNDSYDIGINYNAPRLPAIRLERRQTVQGSGSSTNRFESTSLSASQSFSSKFTLRGEVAQTLSKGRSVFSSYYNNSVSTTASGSGTLLDQIQNNSSTTDSQYLSTRIDASYIPVTWLTLGANVGYSRSSNASQSASNTGSRTGNNARSLGFDATLTPIRAMSVTLNFSESSNGQSLSNFYNPSAGSGSIIPSTTSGQRTRSSAMSLTYSPLDSLNLSAGISQSLSLIPGYDNSDNLSYNFTTNYVPRDWLNMSMNFSDQKYTYVGGQGDSSSRILTGTVSVGPIKRVSTSLTLSHSNFGSALTPVSTGGDYGLGGVGGSNTTGYQQSGKNFSGQLRFDYNVGRNRLIVSKYEFIDQRSPFYDSGTGGSRAGTDFYRGVASIGFALPILEVMSFNVDFNLIHLNDRADSKYSYRARTITADLSARF
jgi:hypothetical protein